MPEISRFYGIRITIYFDDHPQKDKIMQAWEHIEYDEVFEKVPPLDRVEKIVDLKHYINSKKHPFFQPLKQVHKTLVWDNEADIAPEYLHNKL